MFWDGDPGGFPPYDYCCDKYLNVTKCYHGFGLQANPVKCVITNIHYYAIKKAYSLVSFSKLSLISISFSFISTVQTALSPLPNCKSLISSDGIVVIIDPAFLRILVLNVILILHSIIFYVYIYNGFRYIYLCFFLSLYLYKHLNTRSYIKSYRNLYRYNRFQFLAKEGFFFFKPPHPSSNLKRRATMERMRF